MTDKQTPTDAELKALWQLHAADIGGIFYYARAVLAKWGQPAQAAEPVAVVVPCYTPSGKRVALYSAKQDLPIGTKLYAAPQPVAREPLTVDEVEQLIAQWSYELHGDRARYLVRMTEQHHGIKGGQHGTE